MALEEKDDYAIALKLHQQFGHPKAKTLLKLIKNAGIKNRKLCKEVRSVSNACITCLKHKRPSPRPSVCLPLASRFNELLGIDLKKFNNNTYFLVMVDIATRYCQAHVIHNKEPTTIIKGLFVSWITIFGAPQKIISDNGGEFCNGEVRELSDVFCIQLLTTAAESPWSNGICERLNGILGELVSKIIEDTNSGVQIALAWAIAARNTFLNKSGFSPNQLVFGFNPHFPNIYDSTLPASSLENASNEIIRKNDAARLKGREVFIKYEANERIRKALRHNVRNTDIEILQVGDKVLYKRKEYNKWQGPATVTHIDLQAKTVMVKHGGHTLKTHAVSTLKIPTQQEIQSMDETSDIDALSSDQQMTEIVPNPLGQSAQEKGLESLNQDEIIVPNSQHVENKNIDIGNLKDGQRFQGIEKNTGKIISGKILSRAGKKKGINKNCYNVERSCGLRGYVKMEGIQDLKLISDESQMLIFFNSTEVMEAKEKEIENWIDNNVFEEIEDNGQQTISVRWVITEKEGDKPETRARLVARGFEEETTQLKKDSPTCSRETVNLVFWVASGNKWNCYTVDVKAAYLQGDTIKRDVFLRPPKEFDIGHIWKLKKTVYGLCDAARAWYIRVKDELIKLGVEKCPLDNSFFFWHVGGVLEGAICLYVDDFLFTGTHNFIETIINKLMNKFKIGSTGKVNFTYVGLRVNSYTDGLTIDQEHYIDSIKTIPLTKERLLEKDSQLNKKELANFRTLIGQLSWVSTHTRPDIAFETCELGGTVKNAKITDLIKLNKLVVRLRSSHVNIYFPKFESLKQCTIKCFTDASFRNLPQEGSQAGYIIFIENDGENCKSPIYWKSKKISRVVDSTLAAETMALHEGAKTSIYLATVIKQLLPNIITKVICITDNKSLVDALYSTKMMTDRWLRLNILGIGSMLEKGEVNSVQWIDTKNQLADGLTKRGTCRDNLIHAISRN